jgi:hypothetical protein
VTLEEAREVFGYEPIVITSDDDFDSWDDGSDDYPYGPIEGE